MNTNKARLRKIMKDLLYKRILSYFSRKSKKDDNIRACYVIGSRAQINSYPTKFSDLDMEVVVKQKEPFIKDLSWVNSVAPYEFCYPQSPSDDCGMEIRVVFSDNNKLADFVFMTPAEFQQAYNNKQYLNGVFGRGVAVISDKDSLIPTSIVWENTIPLLTEETFNQNIKYLLFHLLYAKNKVLAGELLTAKNTIDVGIRKSLMIMIRWQEHINDAQKDVWHRARHFERWSSIESQQLIRVSSPTYDKRAINKALIDIYNHVRPIITNIAAQKGFSIEYTKDISTYLVELPLKVSSNKINLPREPFTLER